MWCDVKYTKTRIRIQQFNTKPYMQCVCKCFFFTQSFAVICYMLLPCYAMLFLNMIRNPLFQWCFECTQSTIYSASRGTWFYAVLFILRHLLYLAISCRCIGSFVHSFVHSSVCLCLWFSILNHTKT